MISADLVNFPIDSKRETDLECHHLKVLDANHEVAEHPHLIPGDRQQALNLRVPWIYADNGPWQPTWMRKPVTGSWDRSTASLSLVLRWLVNAVTRIVTICENTMSCLYNITRRNPNMRPYRCTMWLYGTVGMSLRRRRMRRTDSSSNTASITLLIAYSQAVCAR